LLHLTDDPDYRILRDSFMDELPERLTAIQNALAEEDWEGLRFRAHQLKGVAGSFGFRETSRIAGHIETCMASGDHRQLDHLVQTLLDSARQSGQPD
jgi:HPt (histidine-containing phosphotransfer) domain-containing protein